MTCRLRHNKGTRQSSRERVPDTFLASYAGPVPQACQSHLLFTECRLCAGDSPGPSFTWLPSFCVRQHHELLLAQSSASKSWSPDCYTFASMLGHVPAKLCLLNSPPLHVGEAMNLEVCILQGNIIRERDER